MAECRFCQFPATNEDGIKTPDQFLLSAQIRSAKDYSIRLRCVGPQPDSHWIQQLAPRGNSVGNRERTSS